MPLESAGSQVRDWEKGGQGTPVTQAAMPASSKLCLIQAEHEGIGPCLLSHQERALSHLTWLVKPLLPFQESAN